MRLNTLGGLWIESDAGASQLSVRPRRLALLAILAAAGSKGATREQVLAVLWPESGPDRARHALSQTLYSLRSDLGSDVVTATATDLRLDPSKITTDIEALRAALATRDWKRASALYTGPFLEGFFLTGAPQFERWAEEERSSVEHEAMRAVELASREATREGRVDDALAGWSRLAHYDPLSGKFAAAHMEALLARGDRADAVTHGQAYVERVRAELDSEPDPTVVALLAKLRGAATRPVPQLVPVPKSAPPVTAPSVPTPTVEPGAPPATGKAVITRRRWPAVAGLAGLGALAVVSAIAVRGRIDSSSESSPILAVGSVQDLVTPDSAQLGGVLSEMLATSLGRLTSLQVIANSRILELMPRGADTSRRLRTEAARRAGATEVLEGELMPLADRQLHLALRRVDLERGIVRGGYQVTGADRLAMFDSITVLIAADLKLDAPTASLGEVATRSPLAYRLYEEGLRAFFQFDAYAANRLFNAAVKEDSAFAMAAYYAWRSEVAIGGSRQGALADHAVALSTRASDRDRLLILAHVGAYRSDMRAVAAAESLATRYPNDPEALIRAADVSRDPRRATQLLERAIALDSAAATGPLAVCRYCDALAALARRYDDVDSLSAVERTYARWSRLRPTDYTPWQEVADFYVGLGRLGDAALALRRADSLGAPKTDSDQRRLARMLRSDDLATANEICRTRLRSSDDREFLSFRGPCALALRMQGRFREALTLMRTGVAPGSTTAHRGLPRDRLHEAVLDFEMGRPRLAASELARQADVAASDTTLPPGVAAGRVAWYLTLASSFSADNDTIFVSSLVDTVESAGVRSLDPRDPLLYRFLNGLLRSRAGQHEVAVRSYRDAISSPSRGFTRINLELARSLLALNRPVEAIAVLRPALRAPLDSAQIFVTRTELHELLGRAFEAAGQRDSAIAHFVTVDRAWRDADDVLSARRDSIRARLASGLRASR